MKSSPGKDTATADEVTAVINASGDWRSKTLSRLRAIIKRADPEVVEELKWKKPTRPMGVPTWSHAGILCVGEPLKNAVRLTFPNGAQLKDPKRIFNTRLDSKTVRAVDFHEDDTVDEGVLAPLIVQAARRNMSKGPQVGVS